MQHTLLVHLFVVFLHYYKLKLFNYKFYVFCSHKIVVSCALFHSLSFSLPLIFTLLAANISHFLTTQKRATFFATLLQNELNSDVARFTTHIKPVLQQIRLLTGFNVSHKTRNIVNFAALWQNKLRVFCCSFFRTLSITLFSFFCL